MPDAEREGALSWFKGVRSGALVAPRILDEGIDVKDAEVGINIASTKTRLQLIQRLGRILRKGDAPKRPEFHHFVAVPTGDDFLPDEDAVQAQDDVSWAVDTSRLLGIPLRFGSPVPSGRVMGEEFQPSEDYIKRRFDADGIIALNIGSIRLGRMLTDYPEELVRAVLVELDSAPAQPLTYVDWTSLLEKSRQSSGTPKMPSYTWYVYVLGGKEPRGIAALLRRGVGENT
jgi:superfamily II DNA or RNA helicase